MLCFVEFQPFATQEAKQKHLLCIIYFLTIKAQCMPKKYLTQHFAAGAVTFGSDQNNI